MPSCARSRSPRTSASLGVQRQRCAPGAVARKCILQLVVMCKALLILLQNACLVSPLGERLRDKQNDKRQTHRGRLLVHMGGLRKSHERAPGSTHIQRVDEGAVDVQNNTCRADDCIRTLEQVAVGETVERNVSSLGKALRNPDIPVLSVQAGVHCKGSEQ